MSARKPYDSGLSETGVIVAIGARAAVRRRHGADAQAEGYPLPYLDGFIDSGEQPLTTLNAASACALESKGPSPAIWLMVGLFFHDDALLRCVISIDAVLGGRDLRLRRNCC